MIMDFLSEYMVVQLIFLICITVMVCFFRADKTNLIKQDRELQQAREKALLIEDDSGPKRRKAQE